MLNSREKKINKKGDFFLSPNRTNKELLDTKTVVVPLKANSFARE